VRDGGRWSERSSAGSLLWSRQLARASDGRCWDDLRQRVLPNRAIPVDGLVERGCARRLKCRRLAQRRPSSLRSISRASLPGCGRKSRHPTFQGCAVTHGPAVTRSTHLTRANQRSRARACEIRVRKSTVEAPTSLQEGWPRRIHEKVCQAKTSRDRAVHGSRSTSCRTWTGPRGLPHETHSRSSYPLS